MKSGKRFLSALLAACMALGLWTSWAAASGGGAAGRGAAAAMLSDGKYVPDEFSFSGGRGKVRITCPAVTVKAGLAMATLVFSSNDYSYVSVDGQRFYGTHTAGSSTFEIPVRLNVNNGIAGMTTAMSSPHEVEYEIYVYIAAAQTPDDAETAADAAIGAKPIAGFSYTADDELESAELFTISRYVSATDADVAAALISVAGAADYLVIDGGAELPAGFDARSEGITVIRRPVESVYAASEKIYDMLSIIGDAASARVRLAGYASEAAVPAFAGECTAPEYVALLKAGCDLFVADAGRAAEPAQALAAVTEYMNLLGIPVFVDASADEATAMAGLEWLKAYGVIFGMEAETNAAYRAAADARPQTD